VLQLLLAMLQLLLAMLQLLLATSWMLLATLQLPLVIMLEALLGKVQEYTTPLENLSRFKRHPQQRNRLKTVHHHQTQNKAHAENACSPCRSTPLPWSTSRTDSPFGNQKEQELELVLVLELELVLVMGQELVLVLVLELVLVLVLELELVLGQELVLVLVLVLERRRISFC
jgi:hypothetical protein